MSSQQLDGVRHRFRTILQSQPAPSKQCTETLFLLLASVQGNLKRLPGKQIHRRRRLKFQSQTAARLAICQTGSDPSNGPAFGSGIHSQPVESQPFTLPQLVTS